MKKTIEFRTRTITEASLVSEQLRQYSNRYSSTLTPIKQDEHIQCEFDSFTDYARFRVVWTGCPYVEL